MADYPSWPLCLVRGRGIESPVWVWGGKNLDGRKLAHRIVEFLNET